MNNTGKWVGSGDGKLTNGKYTFDLNNDDCNIALGYKTNSDGTEVCDIKLISLIDNETQSIKILPFTNDHDFPLSNEMVDKMWDERRWDPDAVANKEKHLAPGWFPVLSGEHQFHAADEIGKVVIASHRLEGRIDDLKRAGDTDSMEAAIIERKPLENRMTELRGLHTEGFVNQAFSFMLDDWSRLEYYKSAGSHTNEVRAFIPDDGLLGKYTTLSLIDPKTGNEKIHDFLSSRDAFGSPEEAYSGGFSFHKDKNAFVVSRKDFSFWEKTVSDEKALGSRITELESKYGEKAVHDVLKQHADENDLPLRSKTFNQALDNQFGKRNWETLDLESNCKIFIHADLNNGLTLIEASDIDGVDVDSCKDIEDVRTCLNCMGDEDGEVFESVLEVPESLLDAIHEEYGVRHFETRTTEQQEPQKTEYSVDTDANAGYWLGRYTGDVPVPGRDMENFKPSAPPEQQMAQAEPKKRPDEGLEL